MPPAPRLLTILAALAGTTSPLLASTEPAGDFPANGAAPQAEITPARGIPEYDGDSESVRRDMVAPAPGADDGEPAKTKEDPQVRAMREGFTRAEASGSAEWRVPVKMRAGATGRMGEWSYGGDASVRHISEDLIALLKFEYRRTDFDFEGVPAAPWQDTDMYRIGGRIESTVSGGWGVFASGGVRVGIESGASSGSAITGQLGAGARYRFIPGFSYYFGIGASTRLDNDILVIPIMAFDFRMGKWSATTMNGLLLGYDVNGDRDLMIEASVLFDASDFRLTPEAGTGRKRSVEFQEVPLTLAVTKQLGRHAFVRAYTTAILWSDYRLRTEGSTSGDFQTPPGLAFGISAGARF